MPMAILLVSCFGLNAGVDNVENLSNTAPLMTEESILAARDSFSVNQDNTNLLQYQYINAENSDYTAVLKARNKANDWNTRESFIGGIYFGQNFTENWNRQGYARVTKSYQIPILADSGEVIPPESFKLSTGPSYMSNGASIEQYFYVNPQLNDYIFQCTYRVLSAEFHTLIALKDPSSYNYNDRIRITLSTNTTTDQFEEAIYERTLADLMRSYGVTYVSNVKFDLGGMVYATPLAKINYIIPKKFNNKIVCLKIEVLDVGDQVGDTVLELITANVSFSN